MSDIREELMTSIIQTLPEDLKEELRTIAGFLPIGAPLSYPKSKVLVYAWQELSKKSLEWSGARLDIRVNPTAYKDHPEAYQAPDIEENPYEAELWKPFADGWTAITPERMDLAEIATYLKLTLGAWGKSQVARRRHARRDRLDNFILGVFIEPSNSTSSVFYHGRNSLIAIIQQDLNVHGK